jgi:hypothetical protein
VRRVTLLAVIACLVAAAAADAARHPHLEKLAPTPADTKIAKAAILRLADLGAGWKQQKTSASEGEPPCKWDLSRFTITGTSGATFVRPAGAVYAELDVFPTSAQALADYAVQSDPKALGCEGEYLRPSFGASTKLVSSRALAAPGIGDRSAARRWVFRAGAATITVDYIAFVRGRVNGGLFALVRGGPLAGADALVRTMDQRLRGTPA